MRERICSGDKVRPVSPPWKKLFPTLSSQHSLSHGVSAAAAKHLPRATSKGPASLIRTCSNREPGFHLKHNPDRSSHAASPSGAMLGDGHVATCSPYHSQTQGGFCPELGLKKLENKEERDLPSGSGTKLFQEPGYNPRCLAWTHTLAGPLTPVPDT